jgi:inositol-1,4,5-trisphosphate 5-phosphatase
LQPVYLSIRIKANQGIESYCWCDKTHENVENVPDNYTAPLKRPRKRSDQYAFSCSECLLCYEHILSQFGRLLADLDPIHSHIRKSHQHLLHETQSENCLQKRPPRINVFDTDKNVSICTCAVHNSEPDLMHPKNDEDDEEVDEKCPVCNLSIVPNFQRGSHIKRLMLANYMIVNQFDSAFLAADNFGDFNQQYEPYTPESVESHSPQIEMVAEEVKLDEGSISTMEAQDFGEEARARKPSVVSIKSGCGVSPRQLMSRLEKLQKSSFDSDGRVGTKILFGDKTQKGSNRRRWCFEKCCIQ